MEGVTPGRIVHYVGGTGQHCAAIITQVDGRSVPAIDLTIFSPTGTHYLPDVPFDRSGRKEPGTWHWIERA